MTQEPVEVVLEVEAALKCGRCYSSLSENTIKFLRLVVSPSYCLSSSSQDHRQRKDRDSVLLGLS